MDRRKSSSNSPLVKKEETLILRSSEAGFGVGPYFLFLFSVFMQKPLTFLSYDRRESSYQQPSLGEGGSKTFWKKVSSRSLH